MVVAGHLGGLAILGNYAVFGFFILSGYLMTLIMQRNYGYSKRGKLKYTLNRFLRIFPMYWFACALSIVLILWVGDEVSTSYHYYLYLPQDTFAWARNVLLLLAYNSEPQLTPPAWALTVELFFYVAIGAGFSKTKYRTHVWFGLSLGYTLVVNVLDMSWPYKYFYITAASLPFATGAMLFHYQAKMRQALVLKYHYLAVILMLMVFLNYGLAVYLDALQGYAFYVNYLLNVLIVAALLQLTPANFKASVWDRFFGDLSYPIYLIHWQVGLLLFTSGFALKLATLPFLLVSLPFVLVIAWLIARYVELPIEKLRQKVKAQP